MSRTFSWMVVGLFLPGLAHVWRGRYWRGIGWALGLLAMSPLLVWGIRYLPTVLGLVLPLAFFIWLRVWGAWDGARVAAAPAAGTGRLLGGIAVIGCLWGGERVRAWAGGGGGVHRTMAGNMIPEVLPGDWFLTLRMGPAQVSRGVVAVFTWPDHASQTFVSRVVGLPGDTIVMRRGKLLVNGRDPATRWQLGPDSADFHQPEMDWQRAYLLGGPPEAQWPPTARSWGPLRIPANSLFVLGDNRGASLDSRFRGFVAASAVTARVHRIYWSRDPDTRAIRWARIGRFVRE